MKPGWRQMLCMALLFVGCGGEPAPKETLSRKVLLSSNIDYARQVYGRFEDASNGSIHFETVALQAGRVEEVRNQPVQELVGVPEAVMTLEGLGTGSVSVQQGTRDPSTDEWTSPVLLSQFDEQGRSTSEASYVLLAVRMSLGGALTEHRALLVCWPSENDCLVMDPVVTNLEGVAEDHARMATAGKKFEASFAPPEQEFTNEGVQRVCSLNSSPRHGGLSYTWPPATVTYKNIWGATVARKELGGQKVGLACYISQGSCLIKALGYSFESSCFANFGFNCACANTGSLSDSSGEVTRVWAQTQCGHKNVLSGSTRISWSKLGVGADFTISWETSGASMDTRGGTLFDSCSWH